MPILNLEHAESSKKRMQILLIITVANNGWVEVIGTNEGWKWLNPVPVAIGPVVWEVLSPVCPGPCWSTSPEALTFHTCGWHSHSTTSSEVTPMSSPPLLQDIEFNTGFWKLDSRSILGFSRSKTTPRKDRFSGSETWHLLQ